MNQYRTTIGKCSIRISCSRLSTSALVASLTKTGCASKQCSGQPAQMRGRNWVSECAHDSSCDRKQSHNKEKHRSLKGDSSLFFSLLFSSLLSPSLSLSRTPHPQAQNGTTPNIQQDQFKHLAIQPGSTTGPRATYPRGKQEAGAID